MDERRGEVRRERMESVVGGAGRDRERKKINGGQVGHRMTCTRLPALGKKKRRRRDRENSFSPPFCPQALH